MARIRIQDENREITETTAIREFLEPFGIWYEKWPVEGRITPESTSEEILAAYTPEVDRLKARGGFVTADVINVSPSMPWPKLKAGIVPRPIRVVWRQWPVRCWRA